MSIPMAMLWQQIDSVGVGHPVRDDELAAALCWYAPELQTNWRPQEVFEPTSSSLSCTLARQDAAASAAAGHAGGPAGAWPPADWGYTKAIVGGPGSLFTDYGPPASVPPPHACRNTAETPTAAARQGMRVIDSSVLVSRLHLQLRL